MSAEQLALLHLDELALHRHLTERGISPDAALYHFAALDRPIDTITVHGGLL